MFRFSDHSHAARLKLLKMAFLILIFAVGGGKVLSTDGFLALAQESPQAGLSTTIQSINFLPEAQVARQPIQLNLSSQGGEGIIRYTTNGSLPSAGSPPFTSTLTIAESTVIRAQVFDLTGIHLSEVETRSYLIVPYDQTIPVVSVVTDWVHLDLLHSAPHERGRAWERPINLEYFEPGGEVGFNVKAGIRIHGGSSRLFNPKKSYRIYFRKDYGGPGRLDYPLFEDSPVTKFDKFILRAGHNDSFTYHNEAGEQSGQAFNAIYIRDQVVRNLHQNMGQPIAHGRWVLLYLNGQFWGLYNLLERLDLQHFQSYSDESASWDVIVKDVGWENGAWYSREETRDGGYGAWLENQNWVGSADFSNPGNIGVLEWRVDMENVFSYMFLQAYVQNYDWPGNNWIVYRRSDPGVVGNEGKWRMQIWDAEYSFGGGDQGFQTDMNTLVKVYSPHDSITRILEKPFIKNCAIKHRFVKRAREYLGVENLDGKPSEAVGHLSKPRVKEEIWREASLVRPFIQMEADRWVPGTGMGLALFDRNIGNALKFVDEREAVILHHLDILRYQTFTECK